MNMSDYVSKMTKEEVEKMQSLLDVCEYSGTLKDFMWSLIRIIEKYGADNVRKWLKDEGIYLDEKNDLPLAVVSSGDHSLECETILIS
jgi:hypothetical protein